MRIFSDDDNKILDAVLSGRKTSRSFRPEAPDEPLLDAIIEAGRLAPFGELAVFRQTDFRKFFVFPSDSSAIPALRKIVVAGLRRIIDEILTPRLEESPILKVPVKAFSAIVNNGAAQIGAAPWFVIVAERRGVYPRVEHASLGYVMENMYLKATALNLGLQVVSGIHLAGEDDPELCAILGLAVGEYGFDACNIGFTNTPLRTEARAVPEKSVRWIR